MSFLKAEWRKLAIANYEIDPSLVSGYVPFGTELDLWKGRCYLSLVGFMFLNTRVLGIQVLYHVNFEEANLRFYVRRFENGEWKRGVVFIKEIVPKPALTFIANRVYQENYETMRMAHTWSEAATSRQVEYNWNCNSGWQSFQVRSNKIAAEMVLGSETEFITEHYWGYARVNENKSYEYEVAHPRWLTYEVVDYKIEVDFGCTYGPAFAFLKNLRPVSVMLAEGSEVEVESKRVIE